MYIHFVAFCVCGSVECIEYSHACIRKKCTLHNQITDKNALTINFIITDGFLYEELERQYSPSMWSKRYSPDIVIENHIDTATKASEEAKSEIPVDLGVPYGNQEGEKMDIFGGDALPKDAPILVYIHGGYWQSLERSISSYVVKPLYSSGVRSIVVGYDIAPKVNMGEIITQVRNAAKYILNMALKFGSKKVWFAGHSAGAHLCCMLLSKDWLDSINLEEKSLLKGLVLISGVFDLTPLLPTYVNEPLGMTWEDAVSFSPFYFEEDKIAEDIQILVAVGENDSPEFQRQSKDFHNKLRERAIQSEYLLIPQVDHFDIVEKLNDNNFELTMKICDLVSKTS